MGMNPDDLFKNAQATLLQVYKIFDKNQNEVNQDVEIVSTWLKTQSHLPEIMPNSLIFNFLLINKFSIERTKQKIDNYYTIRGLMPDFYSNCNPKLPHMKRVLENIYICAHPVLYADLHRVMFYKFKVSNAYSPKETFMTILNTAEVRFQEDYAFNDIHVVDLEHFSFQDMTKLTPSMLMQILTIYEKVYSFRFKAYYMINAPSYFSKVMAILKALMKPKLFQRIHISESDDILSDIFTSDALPKDYGGNGPSLQELTDIMKRKLEQYQDRFDQLDKLRVDESLRPQAMVNDEILGYHGSFKKLNID